MLVLKANWKLFAGTTPHSMPSDTWIIFLKFWRNLCFPPSVHFWCWAVSGFPTLLPVTKKKPQKFSKAEFAQRAAIPSRESAGLPCQQQVQGRKQAVPSNFQPCHPSPALHQHHPDPKAPAVESTRKISADSTLAFKWLAVSFSELQSALNTHQRMIPAHLVPAYPLTYEVGDYCPIITNEETKAKRLSNV